MMAGKADVWEIREYRKQMGRLKRRIEDLILAFLQKRCPHPDVMVAVDILEGSAQDVRVSYCRRCGAVRPEFVWRYTKSHLPWRLPDPNLWKG